MPWRVPLAVASTEPDAVIGFLIRVTPGQEYEEDECDQGDQGAQDEDDAEQR